ncbi:MAG TPA: hypothetical protein VHK88_15775 [Aquihabitans sp.]|jgi:hypothetical protein|nr:hypothetical protein [Aquihabitans sp.]
MTHPGPVDPLSQHFAVEPGSAAREIRKGGRAALAAAFENPEPNAYQERLKRQEAVDSFRYSEQLEHLIHLRETDPARFAVAAPRSERMSLALYEESKAAALAAGADVSGSSGPAAA